MTQRKYINLIFIQERRASKKTSGYITFYSRQTEMLHERISLNFQMVQREQSDFKNVKCTVRPLKLSLSNTQETKICIVISN